VVRDDVNRGGGAFKVVAPIPESFEDSETTLGEDTKDPTTHWDSEKIGCED